MTILIPNTFANKTGVVQLEDLDENFTSVVSGVNTEVTNIQGQVDAVEETVNNIEDPVAMGLVFGPDAQPAISDAAEAQAGTSDTSIITPLGLNNALKGSNQSLSANGYQKFPGGLVIAWATGAVSNAEAEQTITLPYTFTTIYNVQCSTITGAGLAPDRAFQVRSWTTNQVVVFNNAYSSATGNGTPHILIIGI